MRIVLTGASGFIGRHLLPCLLNRGHFVKAISFKHDTNMSSSNLENIKLDIYHDDFTFNDHDCLIHLAWSGLYRYKEYIHIDTVGAHLQFLKKAVSTGCKHMLIVGTCLEYGMVNGCLSESMITNPQIPYAIAKDSLRKFTSELCDRNSVRLQWARPFYSYGGCGNRHGILASLDNAVKNGEETFNMSRGDQLRDYLPIETVVEKLTALAEHEDLDGIVNICSGKPTSVRNLVESHIAKNKYNIQLNLGHYPYNDYEPMAFWGDPTISNKLELTKKITVLEGPVWTYDND